MSELTSGQNRSEYQKQYREANQEHLHALNHTYWIENKETLSKKKSQKFKCDICNGKYVLRHKLTHEKSQKHQKALDSQRS